jgi:Na+-driven multidrug efflux pump
MKLRSRGKFLSISVLLISFGSASCFSAVSSRARNTRTRDEVTHLLTWPSSHQKKPFKQIVRFSILSTDAEPNFNVDAPSVEEEQPNVTASVSSEENMPPPLSTETEPLADFNVSSPLKSPSSPIEADKIPFPDAKKVLAFAVPAIGVWLCSPLLSLIDTSSVGLLAGTAQQAALNPAVAVADYSARLLSFLYTGTTHMVAVAQEADRDVEGKPETAKAFRGALQLSVMVGTGVGSILLLFARPLLKAIIGNEAIDPEVFGAAMKYVRIRSLGMPAAAAIGTAQAACLGMQDIRSPLCVVLVAAAVNLVMDLLLVGRPQLWIGGAAGAAWATMFSQYIAMGLFFKWLCQKPEPAKLDLENWNPITRLASIPLSALVKKTETRGFLANRLHWRDFFRLPDTSTTEAFKPYVVPITVTQVGRCSAYVALGHTVSSSFGTLCMAANQIVTSIFYTLIPIADSLSLTAQSFLPGIVARKPSPEKAKAIRGLTQSLLKVAGLFGVILASTVACLPVALQLFTTDPAVMILVRQIIPVLFIIFSLHGVFCGSEGILLGQRDLKFLERMYAVYFVVVPYLILRVKEAAKTGADVGLSSVWNIFLGYQLFRIAAWVGRVVWLQRRTDREAVLADTNDPPVPVAN